MLQAKDQTATPFPFLYQLFDLAVLTYRQLPQQPKGIQGFDPGAIGNGEMLPKEAGGTQRIPLGNIELE